MLGETLAYVRGASQQEPVALADLPSLLETIATQFLDIGYEVSYRGPQIASPSWDARSRLGALSPTSLTTRRSSARTLRSALRGLEEGAIEVEVNDDGPGVPTSLLNRVLEPFFKGDSARPQRRSSRLRPGSFDRARRRRKARRRNRAKKPRTARPQRADDLQIAADGCRRDPDVRGLTGKPGNLLTSNEAFPWSPSKAGVREQSGEPPSRPGRAWRRPFVASRCRRYARPEFVEFPCVKKGDNVQRLTFGHLKIPGIGVAIGLVVFCRRSSIEQNYDHITIGVDAANRWNQRRRHAGGEWVDHLIKKCLPTRAG